MDAEWWTWIFLGGGLLLMVLETMIPGGVAFFLGLSGVLLAALRVLGLVVDPMLSVGLWLALSAGLVLTLRPVLMRYFGGASSFKLANEDFEAMDKIVQVVEPVGELGEEGRIRFRGATWAARSLEGQLPAGAEARILYRDNLTWVVEPTGDLLGEEHLLDEGDAPDRSGNVQGEDRVQGGRRSSEA